MNAFVLFSELIGIVTLSFIFVYLYYSLINIRLFEGSSTHFLTPVGALILLLYGLLHGIVALGEFDFIFRGTSILIFGYSLIVINNVYLVENYKDASGLPRHGVIYSLPFLFYRFIASISILVGILLLLVSIADSQVYSLIIQLFVFSGIAILTAAEMKLNTDLKVGTPSDILPSKTTIMRDDVLALKASVDITNTFLKGVEPLMGKMVLRNIIKEYIMHHPILFYGTELEKGIFLDFYAIRPNLENVYKEKRVNTVIKVFSGLYEKIRRHYASVTTSKLANKKLEKAYLVNKKHYGDPKIFLKILTSLPEGILEVERLSIASKEELKDKVLERTADLSRAFLKAKEATEEKSAIIDAMMDPLLVLNSEYTIIEVNPAFEYLFKYKEDMLSGMKIYETDWYKNFSKNEENALKDLVKNTVEKEEGGPLEISLPRKGGRPLELTLTAGYMDMEGGKGIVIVFRDVSKLRKREKELKIMGKAVQSSINAVCLTDQRGKILYMNKSFAQLIDTEDKYDHLNEDFFKIIDGAEKKNEIEKQLTESGRWSGEVEIVDENGKRVPTFFSSSIVETDEEEPISLIFSLVDITERKEAEEWKDFLHSLLRHDLSNKIQLIQGYLEIVSDMEEDKKKKDFIEHALNSTSGAAQLIKRVGLLKDMEREELTGEVNPYFILNDSIKNFEKSLSGKNIELVVDAEQTPSKVVSGSRGGVLLESAFNNIIDNAIKHSNCSMIRIISEEGSEFYSVSIEDDGIGFPAEILRGIENKSVLGMSKSSNLGLKLAGVIIERLRGNMYIEKSELGGARIEFDLRKSPPRGEE